MSGLISNLVDKFIGGSHGGSEHSSHSDSHDSHGDHQQALPDCPYPWRAYWDDWEHRYYFVNEQTNETLWDFEEVKRRTSGYASGHYERGDHHEEGYGGGYEGRYEGGSEHGEKKEGHGMAYGALGAGAGLAAGAGLMCGGEKIHEEYEEDKYRVESDVEKFPEHAAQWTGHAVGEVESVPQDIEGGFDRFGNYVEQNWDEAKYDVENAPEDVARWTGEQAGDIERFGDSLDTAYDQGRDEGRYDSDD